MQGFRFLFLFVIIVVFSIPLCAQYQLSGEVLSSEGLLPLQGVTISTAKQPVATTDSLGGFSFSSSSAKTIVHFSHIGFQTASINVSDQSFARLVLYRTNAFLAETVVKAYERNTSIKNIPVTVAVLNRADLERYHSADILPAVNTVPGVKMDERSPGSYRLSIRGNLLRSPFGVRNVKVYWNGIPFTDANGNTYINQLGFGNVGKMEILKGPGGSMYGAGTGGVVLLTSRVPGTGENSISVGTLAGSYGLSHHSIGYRRQSEEASYSLQYEHQQSDGWRRHTNTRKDVANYTGTFDISDKQTINANIFYSDMYYQTPGGLTAALMQEDPRQARPSAGQFRGAEQQRAALYLKTFYAGISQDYQFNENWSNSTSVYTSHTRFRNPSILNYQRKTEMGIGGRSVTRYSNGSINVHAGVEYQNGFTSTRTFGNQSGVSDTLQFDDEITANQYNIFLQADIDLGQQFILNAGLSHNYRYGFTRLNDLPLSETNKTFDPVLVPRISLLKKINEQLGVYASFSKGYSPPTIDEVVPSTGVFNRGLDAEKGTNYEVGVRAEIARNKLSVEAAAYQFYLNQTIVSRRDAAGADYFVNTGKTDQRGYELSIKYVALRNETKFLRALNWWANFTHIYAKFSDYRQGNSDFSGKKLTGTPPNVFVLGADLVTKPGVYAHFTYNYTDIIPLNDANSFFGSQYNLFFGRLGYKRKLSTFLEADIYFSYDRSFNNPYGLGNDLNAAGNRYFNPSAPKNVAGGIQLKFIL